MNVVDNNQQVVGQKEVSQILPSRPRQKKSSAHITSYRPTSTKTTQNGSAHYLNSKNN